MSEKQTMENANYKTRKVLLLIGKYCNFVNEKQLIHVVSSDEYKEHNFHEQKIHISAYNMW